MDLGHAALLAAFLVLSCLVSGCGSSSGSAPRLVIISPHRDEIRAEVARGFNQWLRQRGGQQADVVWQDIGGGTAQIARYLRARFEANPDGIGIDLLFGGGTDIYIRFADQALLEPLDLAALLEGRIPPELHGVPLYDPQGRWFGPMLSSFGILSNREVLKRIGYPGVPASWDELAQPKLAGWVGAGDPRLTGSVHMVYEIILQGEGWDEGFRKLLELGANAHSFIRDSGTLTRSVITGEVAAAGNIDVNALSAVARYPDVMTFTLPTGQEVRGPDGKLQKRGGTVINADAIAVLKGAPQKELARSFVEFTLSDAGQKLFLLRPGIPGGPERYPLCRLSVVQQLYADHPPAERSTGSTNPFEQTQALRYDNRLASQRWDALNDLMGAVIIDVHEDLAAAWKALRAVPEEQRLPLAKALAEPPCTAQALLDHARRIVSAGQRSRAAQINQWSETARARYRGIRQAALEITPP